jgi:hypothetical protein
MRRVFKRISSISRIYIHILAKIVIPVTYGVRLVDLYIYLMHPFKGINRTPNQFLLVSVYLGPYAKWFLKLAQTK